MTCNPGGLTACKVNCKKWANFEDWQKYTGLTLGNDLLAEVLNFFKEEFSAKIGTKN